MREKQYSIKMFSRLLDGEIKYKNFVDFYGRLSVPEHIQDVVLVRSMGETFKNDKLVYKLEMSNIDLEKLDKTYLLFSNGLKLGEHKFTFMCFDEFMKNIPVKSSFKVYDEIQKYFFTPKNYNMRFLMGSVIVIEEFLTYEQKFINIYCNKNCAIHIKKMLRLNHVKWFKSSKSQLLKDIRSSKKRKTEWEENLKPDNNYNKYWEDETVLEDFLPCDTVEDNIKYRYLIDRLI